ncbi:Type IV secretory pathway, VirD2 components (relaxase) [Malonomonas rubra DSM 5091]|uniref:Type IV secretory pathway, VirD2 components (Relaxase) n=1 Tax=Malonomonas rubra DSM 5091 TaxID=1122189 RepID=A0A1M6KTX5_MALRU|nr:relaxase/mobilization nuclease domain-containing protein [Malonomonas rubra]SHJ62478.1 Type IV secretory pathway, VirD2 components (relaxase) [Malonomonas rubra DSM 5091]
MSDKAFGLAEGILEGDPKLSRQKPRDLNIIRQRVERVVKRRPEVMVKITGNTKGEAHLKTHLDYITRKGELEAENERGEIIDGRADVAEVAEEWMLDAGRRKKNTRDSTNIVLSMPPGTNAAAVKDAAREFAQKTFAENHQYLFVQHQDEKHPHVHLTVKNLGYDGTRLHVKKGDPQIWREAFAKQLRKHGVKAEATSRAPRGVVKKSVKQAIQSMRKRGVRSEVDQAKVRAAITELKEGVKESRPWESRIKERQTGIRQGWLTVAKELAKSSNAEDQTLAEDVMKFVKTMPPLQTERHEIQAKIAGQVRQTQTPQQARNKNQPKPELKR